MHAPDVTRIIYISPNGRRWHLRGERQGEEGVLLMPGPTGLDGSALEPITTQGARQVGVTVEDVTIGAGMIDFEVLVQGEPGRSIAEVERRWKASWDSLRPGWICVWKRAHGWWWIRAQKAESPIQKWQYDSTESGHSQYEMSAIAPNPLWSTADQSFPWKASAVSSDFVPGYLTVFNRGGRDTHGRMVFNGPGTWRFMDSGKWITLPALREGEELRLDLDPAKRTLFDNLGINRWAQISGARFRETVPAGGQRVIELGIANGTLDSQALFTVSPRMEYLP